MLSDVPKNFYLQAQPYCCACNLHLPTANLLAYLKKYFNKLVVG